MPLAIALAIGALAAIGAIAVAWYYCERSCELFRAPSVLITSPAAGAVWPIGSTHAITWTARNVPVEYNISVTLRRIPPPPLPADGQEFDPILFINLPNTGRTDWTVPDGYPSGTYILGITAYKSIPIIESVSGESAPFSITR